MSRPGLSSRERHTFIWIVQGGDAVSLTLRSLTPHVSHMEYFERKSGEILFRDWTFFFFFQAQYAKKNPEHV